MRIWIFTLLCVLGVAVVVTPSSANTFYYQAGALCSQTVTETGDPDKSTDGTLTNSSTTANMTVVCPVAQYSSSTQDVESFKLYYYENNNGSDTDDRFICAVNMSTDNGTNYVSSFLYSCSTSGGCGSANSTDNPGYGNLSWSNPFSSQVGLVYIGMECTMCEASPGSCYILGYRVELVAS